jgi:MYXO-CTERM domain-containing protein
MTRTFPCLLGALVLSLTESALGYCGATTCGEACTTDPLGCAVDGVPLAWPDDSLITITCAESCDDVTIQALDDAVRVWQAVECDGASPHVVLATADDLPEDMANGVVTVEVIEDAWPFGASAVGRTTLDFGTTSGTILRATIALNAQNFVLGFASEGDEADVQAVLTHELGHALGLAHSSVSGATMQPEAEIGHAAELRTLHEDDEQGLCALYPPADPGAGGEGGGPSPNGSAGGCSVAHAGAQTKAGATMGAGWSAVGIFLLALWRRRVSSIPRSVG